MMNRTNTLRMKINLQGSREEILRSISNNLKDTISSIENNGSQVIGRGIGEENRVNNKKEYVGTESFESLFPIQKLMHLTGAIYVNKVSEDTSELILEVSGDAETDAERKRISLIVMRVLLWRVFGNFVSNIVNS